jgi:ricin-type beta-trefoil lectin protein
MFTMTRTGSTSDLAGIHELKNKVTGGCLDVTGVSYTDYATLQVWQCSGNWNQRWNIY